MYIDQEKQFSFNRVKVGLLILKHLYQLADRETVKELKQNMYAQYLCDPDFHQGRLQSS